MIFKGEEKIVGIRRLNVGFITRVSNNTTCKEKKNKFDSKYNHAVHTIYFNILASNEKQREIEKR